MKDIKKNKKFLWYYIIIFLPLLFLCIIFFTINIDFDIPDIFIYILVWTLLFNLILGIIISIYLFFHFKNQNQKPKLLVLILGFVSNLIIMLVIILPNLFYNPSPRRAPLSACKSNMKSIAITLDMYQNDYQYLPTEKKPAADNGILIKEEYLRMSIKDPKTKRDYIVIYDHEKGTYKVFCPNPEKYEYMPKKYLKNLYYDSEKGIITDPPNK